MICSERPGYNRRRALDEAHRAIMVDVPTNRRRFPRINAPIYFRPARLRSARHPVVDIGLGGLRVYSDEALKLGERLDIELLLPEERALECLVRVVWVHPLPNGPAAFDVGLELLNVKGDGQSALELLLRADRDPGTTP